MFLQDLRYSARLMLKKPSFTIIAVITLALGIGANTAIFSVVNAVLLRTLPYAQPERLVVLRGDKAGRAPDDGPEVSFLDFSDFRSQSQLFEQAAAFRSGGYTLTGVADPERVRGARVTASFFPMLRVNAILGRAFLPAEDQPGSERVVMMSHSFWQRRFNRNPHVIGQSLTLNGRPYTIIGVLPAGFHFPLEIQDAELWGTLALDGANLTERGSHYLVAAARLQPNVTLDQAQAALSVVARNLEQQYPSSNAGRSVQVVALQEQLVGKIRLALLVLLSAVAFVLLIACANVASLLLVRAAARRKEMAIRAALGANRWRVARQLLTESLLLALLGGGVGWIFATWLIDGLGKLSATVMPQISDINLDARVLGFTVGVTLLTSVIFGLVPALQASRFDLNQTLKDSNKGASAGTGHHRLRQALVVAEVALALVLLVGAGLLIRSFVRLQQVDLGFNPENVLKLRLTLPASKYGENHLVTTFYQQALERIKALPGVQSVGMANITPLSGNDFGLDLSIAGRPAPPPGQSLTTQYRVVSPDYFRAMGMALRSGRAFTERDHKQAPSVVIINETLARRYWPGEDALGQRLRIHNFDEPEREVVGVVADVKHYDINSEARPELYVPFTQSSGVTYDLVIRAASQPMNLVADVRRQILSLDPDLPVFGIQTMSEVVAQSIGPQRFSMLLLGIFAALALLLATIGIYGVTAYSVTQRVPEIGIRMALGAQPRDVLKMILWQGLRLTMIGVSLGLIAALGLTQLMTKLLFGIAATDPMTFGVIAALLTTVALAACYLPARRAAKVDPMVALRYE